MRISLLLALLLGCCPLQAWSMSELPTSSSRGALQGKLAPEFTLETTAGTTKTLTQARAGKKSVMIFWATWCPHCREELERLSQKLQEIQSKGIEVILVDVGESREDAKAYLDRHHLPIESFLDEDNTISGLYGVRGVPTTILIDEKGFIRSINHEFPSDYEEHFTD